MELSDVKSALSARSEDVCRLLLPGGKIEKNEWVCGDIGGSAGKSLKVVLSGEKAGIFKDFAGDLGGSNLLELWVQAKGIPFQTALSEAKAWLGLRGVKLDNDLRGLRKKAYAKPDKTGITWMANKVEFYLTTDRKITKDVLDLYRVSMTDDERAIVFPYLNESTTEAEMLKFLMLERDSDGKKKTWTSKNTPKVLFGKHTVRPEDRYIVITEGEIDAMSYRVEGMTGLSVPFGAKWEGKDGKDPNDEWIENDWEFISRFERIYLSMDEDEEGRKAQASIVKRLGRERCFIIRLPLKDANKVLLDCEAGSLKKAFDSAQTLDPEVLKNAGHYRDEVLDRYFSGDANAKLGIPLPFGNYPFHLRWNEWTAVTGQNGGGKSQILGYILVYLWKLSYKSCVASLEVSVGQTLFFYVAQALGTKTPKREDVEAAMDWLAHGFWFFDQVGEAKWQEVIETFRYAYRRHGCRFFVIDSWMKMGIRGDDFETQGIVCNAISDFVRDCDVHVFVVAHPRKLKNEIEVVGKMDVKGSGELTDQAHNVLVVWRNYGKEKEIEKMLKMKDDDALVVAKRRVKPDATLFVSKQRNDDGDQPTIDLWFVKECKQFFGHYRNAGVPVMTQDVPETPAAPNPTEEPVEDSQPF